MTYRRIAATAALGLGLCLGWMAAAGPASAKDEYQLPPEVTPAIRAACETDVRRMCIGREPTVDQVKSCVMQNFMRLNRQCQIRLVAAGLGP